ncbi:hypothetical protein CCAN12_530002 [Capnocytophaga canimorsus]|uniref:Uncharacterized protein n=1 Tax=Capnocytophaga canimorsus TaxID=28188 RepID=A0A0B7H9S0_9FLAO|nr:hypothetical protein CCAN12_530002 [Capnocytophaga canimorsus]
MFLCGFKLNLGKLYGFFDLDEDLYPLFEDRKYRLIYRKLSF